MTAKTAGTDPGRDATATPVSRPDSARGGGRVPALVALDTSRGVHEALLARVKGMADGADLDVDLVLGRERLDPIPARADDGRLLGLWMDARFHSSPPLPVSRMRSGPRLRRGPLGIPPRRGGTHSPENIRRPGQLFQL